MAVDDDGKVTRAYAKKYARGAANAAQEAPEAAFIWGCIARRQRTRNEKRRRKAPFGATGSRDALARQMF
ncbi:hypothetical protein [Paraburkholderia eburnea]|uniref:hypothetical protein n=1 Tax=Paraburkholderia eburnea TaxID=1189126 RepID=UPI0011B05C77|nr:hypothetical protein [Paraburkholderia eburnea]